MTENEPVVPTTATPEPEAPESPEVAPTVEQVEASWAERMSKRDLAHNAEVATLRNQLAAAEAAGDNATSQADVVGDEVSALKKQLSEAQKNNQQQQADFQARIRAAEYPFAAEALDAGTLGAMDEAKLSGLNARLAPSKAPTVPVDPNTPGTGAPSAKPNSDKTAAELAEDIKRMAPDFAALMNRR